jgi:GMP synthase-like glutamine amidotransferase
VVLARSPVCAQAFRVGDAAWGIQFHAEVSRADALDWITEYHVDPDAVRIGIEPARMRAETEPRMEAWNELGRGLCSRFVAAARAARPSAVGSGSG